MANNYSQVMCEHGVPCTDADGQAITAALAAADDDDVYHGFEFDYEGGLGYLFAEESGCIGELPVPVLQLVGRLIAAAGWPHWEFGVAWTCSKMRPGEFGGTAFRIMPDGTLVDRVETWP